MGELVGSDSHLKFDGIALRGKFFEQCFLSSFLSTKIFNHGKAQILLPLCFFFAKSIDCSFAVGEEFMQEINSQFRTLQRLVMEMCSSCAK